MRINYLIPPEEVACVGYLLTGPCLYSSLVLCVFLFCFVFWLQSPTKGAPFPSLLYEFLVHIVNRDISQQVFWNIFLLVFQSM